MLALYESPQQWERLSRAGQAGIGERFSFAAATARIREDLARIVDSATRAARAPGKDEPS